MIKKSTITGNTAAAGRDAQCNTGNHVLENELVYKKPETFVPVPERDYEEMQRIIND